MNKTERFFYLAATAAFLPLLAGMLFLGNIKEELLYRFPQCLFYQVTGHYCPGCGGTRALFSLAQGRWAESFWYHPVVLYAAAAYLLFLVSGFRRRHTKRFPAPFMKGEYLCYAGIALILLQWVLKFSGVWVLPPS